MAFAFPRPGGQIKKAAGRRARVFCAQHLAPLLIALGIAGCSSQAQGSPAALPACGLIVHWQGHTYRDFALAARAQHLDPRTVVRPTLGKMLGVGVMDACTTTAAISTPQAVPVYEVPSAPAKTAIAILSPYLLIVDGGRIPEALIKQP